MNTINLGVFKLYNHNNYPIWHPYSNVNSDASGRLKLVRGEGVFLFDAVGRKYLDATSGLWNMSLGYSNQAIEEAILRQTKTLPFCSLFEHTCDMAIETASVIIQELGANFNKVFFTCSGSESIELALKIARKYWRLLGQDEKQHVLSLKQSYHGTYYGSMGVSGSEVSVYHEFGQPSKTFFLDFIEEGETITPEMTGEIEAFINNNHDKIACIVIESILASEGVKVLHKEYLKWLCGLCKKNEILVVLDEVALGFYRTGTAFYYQQYGVEPDIVCLAKGINAGYLPMGATVITTSIVDAYSRFNDFLAHGTTQGGNLIACAACLATLKEYHRMDIAKTVTEKGKLLLGLLKDQLIEHSNVANVKGKGLLIGIDLVRNKKTRQQADLRFVKHIQRRCEERGVLVYTSKSGLTIVPPFIISESEVKQLVNILSDVVFDELL